jgi:aryl-alcohol dehydrogenase-like predicted oxidoreductase
VERRRLGRTGHHSSVVILGGAAFWDGDPAVVGQAFDAAIAAGVNHLDVAPQYGRAQELLGPFVPAVRDHLFVACKTLRHNADGVRAQLDESLRLLGCDYFDLYQLHAVTDLDELDARRDAVAAVLQARDQGLCRFAGITGHGLDTPAAQLEAVRRYDLDTVMFPVSPQLWSDGSYRRDAEALLEIAAERDLGVMAIKAVAARPWAGRTPTTTTWYEPYTTREEVARGVEFALSTRGVQAFCTPSDLGLVSLVLDLLGTNEKVGMTAERREAASAATSHEASIFPMPVG